MIQDIITIVEYIQTLEDLIEQEAGPSDIFRLQLDYANLQLDELLEDIDEVDQHQPMEHRCYRIGS